MAMILYLLIVWKFRQSEIAKKISNRHFSIGGNGIVMILRSIIADAKMRMLI